MADRSIDIIDSTSVAVVLLDAPISPSGMMSVPSLTQNVDPMPLPSMPDLSSPLDFCVNQSDTNWASVLDQMPLPAMPDLVIVQQTGFSIHGTQMEHIDTMPLPKMVDLQQKPSIGPTFGETRNETQQDAFIIFEVFRGT